MDARRRARGFRAPPRGQQRAPRPSWCLLLVAVLASCVRPVSPHGARPGLGDKTAAAMPSFAPSGAGAVVTVHGLNFAPGGARGHLPSPPSRAPRPRSSSSSQRPTHPPPSRAGPKCEHCSGTRDASLCRFDDHDPHALSYAGAVTVRCSLAPRSRVLGFAALAVSNNGGVDWIELASAEYAIVNFIVPPRTDAAFAPHAAPGVPAYFRGVHFAVEGDPAAPPHGCAFDGAPAASGAGGGVSSALFRCETPTRGATRVEIVPFGRRRTDADAGTNAAARTDVALSVPSSRVAVAAISSRGVDVGTRGSGRAHAASAEGGGTAFVVHLTVRRDDDSDADADGDGDGSIDEKVDAISSSGFIGDSARASGCLFGTTRVSACRGSRRTAPRSSASRPRARPGLCFSPRARDTPRRRETTPTRVLREYAVVTFREPRPPPSSWSSPTSRASGSRSRDPPSPPPRDARGSISPRDPSSPRRRPGRFVWRVARGARLSTGRISPRSSTPTRTTP